MARATRSKPAPKESSPEPAANAAKTNPLPPSTINPPKLFVLPKIISPEARIVTLDNPSTCNSSRYLFCPDRGFYEFTRIAAPKTLPRSWLIVSEEDKSVDTRKQSEEIRVGTGYITKASDLFIATPIDILFLILPALAPKSTKQDKQLFLSLDDHLDTLSASSRHFKALFSRSPALKSLIEKRMPDFCDTVDAGDESMYRLSPSKLYTLLVRKAERMCANGLPTSMEEKFIKPTLDIPIMNIKREDATTSTTSTSELVETGDSQATTITTITANSQSPNPPDSQATDITIPDDASTPAPRLITPPTIPPLLRLRTALTYLFSAYIPPTLLPVLQSQLSTPPTSTSLPDFVPLTTHLSALSALRSEAAALRSMSDNISRKRVFEEDEEKIAEREEKKRKKEEEDKRKKGESRGIKQLKKVDTKGMMKLSSFFAKAPAKK
ncbi:ribonuclease H2, subunit B [Dendryphion nanum]|uniref:Ribonuclease H2 subunit B n=1 Tax=Dendryphion nanum TaxID=256645 RepID=A0A9P9EL91_9PLEO|nr:ribonuclease H2, subunit B [Dendryphion nanum]